MKGGGVASDELSRTFGALADPTRRRLLGHLLEGPATVTALAEPIALTLAAVSKHLRVLEEAGLVRRERNGQYRPVLLDVRPLQAVSQWLRDYEAFFQRSFDALEEHLATGARIPPPPDPHDKERRRS
ncbi:ArsR family transcriptional regulator [Microbacterium sp. dk485]|uniref:ArsR family transcriptional regulator n=1 Tax=Microbacterium wangchenii TaxID=2541726 RepID=A0ABX5SN68_9MICO|nr:metalloregulator ArsR/SmtB family transcription factor [Microbacterium sp. EYE_512]QBR87573.1 ArsR family transcriptional regulator [Microbacterium wangchenii]TFV84346.1 ArsR family transcriptional regulator [Microbacterium sp. dk485]TXK15841.1 winged helix-turn-helix transcriptional regulator [Microbacterium wangchenii]